ncbi:helix-turn-helix domain-containing protein [Lactiplantibacillus plantarum]|uniref:helix-turn-helix domain-containing protein n=1 Tax=Lactiplantibacillus plantarum TaxID=1590 RepID=UPI0010727874|nr:XRE family transcriptional regulator [Lactiplantibacillus plantarum]MBS0939358.1 LexA family transcriptional regulator [Lactiplantibacillus plantarum]
MNLSQNIKRLRKSHGYTQKDLASILKVKPTSISAWESGRNKPLMDKITIMSTLFGVSTSELVGDTFYKNDINDIYNQLNPDRQQNVYNYADNQLREQNNTIVRMPRTQIKLLGAVSAGTGEELQDDTTEVDYTGTVPQYDYALQVNGDSMEPLFTDQQIIFVKYSEEAFNGQIVIAYVDGKAYVKKYHCNEAKCELVSLNSKYDPIDVSGNENFKIKGVVVL